LRDREDTLNKLWGEKSKSFLKKVSSEKEKRGGGKKGNKKRGEAREKNVLMEDIHGRGKKKKTIYLYRERRAGKGERGLHLSKREGTGWSRGKEKKMKSGNKRKARGAEGSQQSKNSWESEKGNTTEGMENRPRIRPL